MNSRKESSKEQCKPCYQRVLGNINYTSHIQIEPKITQTALGQEALHSHSLNANLASSVLTYSVEYFRTPLPGWKWLNLLFQSDLLCIYYNQCLFSLSLPTFSAKLQRFSLFKLRKKMTNFLLISPSLICWAALTCQLKLRKL